MDNEIVQSWIERRRAAYEKAVEDAARVLWDHGDPEGESPNENFEAEPKWEQERLRQTARTVLESSDAHTVLPLALSAFEEVLRLHHPATTYLEVSACESKDEEHEDERHKDTEDGTVCLDLPDYVACRVCQVNDEPVEYPCATVRAIETTVNDPSLSTDEQKQR